VDEDVTTQKTGLRRRWVAFGVALGVAVLVALLAPPDWPAGEGSAVLEYQGQTIVQTDLTLGTSDELVVETIAEGLAFTLTFPSGLPVEGEILARVAASSGGEPQRLFSEDVEVRVTSPEMGNELIPVIGWDDERLALEAVRRPPQDAAVVLGLLGLVVVLWVTEALPLFVTSLLIPVVLVFSGVATAVDATSSQVS
jgi:di/tricarboxylate transporter